MAAEVAAPLSKTQDILLISEGGSSSGKLRGEIANLVATLPPTIQAITGVDLTKVCSSLLTCCTMRKSGICNKQSHKRWQISFFAKHDSNMPLSNT